MCLYFVNYGHMEHPCIIMLVVCLYLIMGVSPEFVTNPNRLQMWRVFLNKIGEDEKLGFAQVMDTITINLKPLWDNLNR